MRNLKANEIASYGVLILIVVFIINAGLLAISQVIIKDDNSLKQISSFHSLPNNYENMTTEERYQWLFSQHGGEPTEYYCDVIGYLVPLQCSHCWFLFPDGAEMNECDYTKFGDGTILQFNAGDLIPILFSFFSFNPPILSYIGIAGWVIRAVFVACIAVAIVDVIWFG